MGVPEVDRVRAGGGFEHYAMQGAGRSYARVAEEIGASRGAVASVASMDAWENRVSEVDRIAAARGDANLGEALAEMNARHIAIAREIQVRALEALRKFEVKDASAAVRALAEAVRIERLALGEPTQRVESTVEEIVIREQSRWLKPKPKVVDVLPEVTGNGHRE